VGAGSNLEDLYEKAMEQEAWHYAGTAKFMRAYGFMMMHELYGETSYTYGLGSDETPEYDNGKTIFLGCLAEIDEAIELFSKTQDVSVTALSVGDTWNGGDASKWLKMCYLMKARWCNNLIKKADGSYLDGKYDETTILDCITKAQTSNSDNTWVDHKDDAYTSTDVLGWGESLIMARQFSVQGQSSYFRVSKALYDNLTDFAGNGVEDPRADHLLPWTRSQKSADTPAEIKWSDDGKWRRSLGFDMSTTLRTTGSPYSTSFGEYDIEVTDEDGNVTNTSKGYGWYSNTTSNSLWGDTVYVRMLSGSINYFGTVDLYYRSYSDIDESASVGIFYNRPSSPNYIATYAEAMFIKAEVLFNQGDKSGAYTAYKAGVQASIEIMNQKVNVWYGESTTYQTNPTFIPMTDDEIADFLANGIGTQADLTLGHILTQKQIALFYSIQGWNDMRRYDYDTSLFFNWDVPAEYYINASSLTSIPDLGKSGTKYTKGWRRWSQCSHETNYNIDNLCAIGTDPELVALGAVQGSESWNQELDVWTIPVWFDSTVE
ncbi:MAG: SusD/RagB family nutrient-binding outer membrane lipoprotein, partial [Bacteroidales bacterium]